MSIDLSQVAQTRSVQGAIIKLVQAIQGALVAAGQDPVRLEAIRAQLSDTNVIAASVLTGTGPGPWEGEWTPVEVVRPTVLVDWHPGELLPVDAYETRVHDGLPFVEPLPASPDSTPPHVQHESTFVMTEDGPVQLSDVVLPPNAVP